MAHANHSPRHLHPTTHPHLFHPSTLQAWAWFLLCWVVWSLGPIHTHTEVSVKSAELHAFKRSFEKRKISFFRETEEKHESNDWLFCQKVRVTWRLWAGLLFSKTFGVGKRLSSTPEWPYLLALREMIKWNVVERKNLYWCAYLFLQRSEEQYNSVHDSNCRTSLADIQCNGLTH